MLRSRRLATWLLVATFAATVPAFIFFFVVAGFVPVVAVLTASVSFPPFALLALPYLALHYLVARLLAGRFPAGMTLVDGIGIGDVGEVVLRDRRRLAADGILVVVVAVDAHHGEVVAGPDLVNRGVVDDETAADILEEARNLVMLSLKDSAAAEVTDPAVLQQNIRR